MKNGPFHQGEIAIQKRAGETARARANGAVVKGEILEGALSFIARQPLVALASTAGDGSLWASVIFGAIGFMRADDPHAVHIDLSQAAVAHGDLVLENLRQDSRIGTFGVLALIFSLGLRAAALSGMPIHEAAMAFIAAAALSRALPAGIVAALSPARADGLGSIAAAAPETAASRSILAALIAFIGAVVAIGFVAAVWSFLLAFAIGIFVAVVARHRLGGYTGDVLGAAQQLSEVAVLLLCAAVI